MERKTKIHAEPGKQDLMITRAFDLPLELLFKAYVEPAIIEEWMGTKVVKLENKPHGSFHFITTDPKGHKHGFNGTIHEFVPNEKITRTFEMDNTPFGVQLEFLEFERLTDDTSRLVMQVIYQSPEHREKQLKMPFQYGVNMAHDRLQEVLSTLKK